MQGFTHTFSSPSNKSSLFHIPYSRAGSKSASSLFHSLTLPGGGPNSAPWLPSLRQTPIFPRLGPLAPEEALLRTKQLTWQRRLPDLAAASIQDKQLVLSGHGKPATFLMALHRRMSKAFLWASQQTGRYGFIGASNTPGLWVMRGFSR